jgi:enoyl-CoA hydratase
MVARERSGQRRSLAPDGHARVCPQSDFVPAVRLGMSVLTEDHGPVRIVTIDRPECRNAVDRPTAAALLEAFEDFEADHELRVAILTGSNGAFCAGADLKAVSTGSGNRIVVDGSGPMGPTRLDLSKPVIAAIEGHAVAGGLELAVWCDLRIAASDAVLGVYCRRWGVPLVDGGTIRLPRLIGASRASDMILTGRGVKAEEALAIGLVNRIADPGAALHDALALADELAALPQNCMRSDLRSSKAQWSLDMPAALLYETTLGLGVVASGETRDGATRFADGAGRHGQAVT